MIENKKILFFDNVDSAAFYRKLHGIKNPEQTLWVLISKSGYTVETLMQAECVDGFLKSKFFSTLARISPIAFPPCDLSRTTVNLLIFSLTG